MARNLKMWLTVGLALLLLCPLLAMAEPKKPVRIEGTKGMYLRVVARPMSSIYKESKDGAEVVEANVRTFQPYYVYTRPASAQVTAQTKEEGWYEVGENDQGKVLGWMKASDVMEWKHTMCLLFTPPEGRSPVLMFDKIKPLQNLVKDEKTQRDSAVDNYYKTIAEAGSKKLPEDFPIIAQEPKRWIDPKTQFYLMPVLEAVNVEMDGEDATLVKFAAATTAQRGQSNVRTSKEAREEAVAAIVSDDAGSKLKNQKIDLVYVMDMTNSMGPYIQETLKTILDMAVLLSQKLQSGQDVEDNIRFGLWGYRDNESINGMEFNTRNFTAQLQSAQDFGKTLETVKPARVGSKGFAEDVFGGVDKAILETKWTEDALRFIVLVGDAPGHELGHEWNSSKKDEAILRQLATDNKIFLLSIYIKNADPRLNSHHIVGERQFSALAVNPGTNDTGMVILPANNYQEFSKASKAVAEKMVEALVKGQQGQMITAAPATPAAPAGGAAQSGTAQAVPAPPASASQQAGSKAAAVIRAAQVQFIGKETKAKAPRDVTAFALDKDLLNPATPSMNVCVLLNKRQLDSLVKMLKDVIKAGKAGQLSGEDFFSVLQGVVATAGVDPDKVKNAKSLAESGLVPEFISGLPYKSQLLALNNERWSSWSAMEQSQFLQVLDAKIQAYQDIHDQASQWVKLNQGDDPDQFVYPVNLELMP